MRFLQVNNRRLCLARVNDSPGHISLSVHTVGDMFVLAVRTDVGSTSTAVGLTRGRARRLARALLAALEETE